MTAYPAHLKALEAESIYVLREVAAQAARPVLLYSIGKDSSVLLHLARKAFFPARLPFPLLHIDTKWKFRDMIAFRDATAQRFQLDLRIHTNPDGLRQGINPFDHGSSIYTQVMKTDALKQALTEGRYDMAIGGARRDEERCRAKERVFSARGPGHTWEPERQRPELWRLYSGNLAPGETLRAFPLSNWTELEVWTYIQAEGIDVVPLYFAAARPTVLRDGALIVVAKLFVEAGLVVLVSFISPYRAERMLARECVEAGEFLEIFVDTPVDECRRRDPKGLYQKADTGQIRNFTGVSAPYEEPLEPDIRLRMVRRRAGSAGRAGGDGAAPAGDCRVRGWRAVCPTKSASAAAGRSGAAETRVAAAELAAGFPDHRRAITLHRLPVTAGTA